MFDFSDQRLRFGEQDVSFFLARDHDDHAVRPRQMHTVARYLRLIDNRAWL